MIIDEIEYPVVRVKFKKFIALEEIREQIIDATDALDDQLAVLICSYVSVALSCQKSLVDALTWKDVLSAYAESINANTVYLNLPFLKPSKKHPDPVPWDYQGRTWYSHSHMIAKEFGWTLEYIAEMEIEDAFHLLQEIVVSNQLEREWQWDISEKSTGYDESTKRSKHIPLPRPDWMAPIPVMPKKVKIPLAHMPKGIVLRLDGSHVEYK